MNPILLAIGIFAVAIGFISYYSHTRGRVSALGTHTGTLSVIEIILGILLVAAAATI
jgi:hypothetical protein